MGGKRTQGSGSIIARANGRFTAQISDTATGRRRSVGTFATKTAAEKAIAHSIVEGPPPTLEVRFGAYLAEWLEDQALVVKATTAAKNRAMVRRVLREPIARRKVRDLKPEDFHRLYRELRDHGKADGTPLAASSVKKLDQVLKSALAVAEPSAVGDDPHIAIVTFTTDAEDGVGYQGGGRAFRGGRGRGKYSWASERPARRLGGPTETPPQSAYIWTVHRTVSRPPSVRFAPGTRIPSLRDRVGACRGMPPRARERNALVS